MTIEKATSRKFILAFLGIVVMSFSQIVGIELDSETRWQIVSVILGYGAVNSGKEIVGKVLEILNAIKK